MKKYRVKITEIDGEDKKVLHEADFNSIAMLASCEGNKFAEVMVNESIADLAFKISQSKQIIKSAEIAVEFNKFKDKLKKDLESELADSIRKGE